MRPKLPVDFNSNSAYEKLKFVADNYENLVQMFMTIMEHLKLPVIEETTPEPSTEGECLFKQYTVTNPKPVYIKLHLRGDAKAGDTPLYIGSTTTSLKPTYVASLTRNYTDEQVPYPNGDSNLRYVVRIYRSNEEANYSDESTINDINDECADGEGFKFSYYTPKLAIYNTTTGEFVETFTGNFETEIGNILYDAPENMPSSTDFLRILQIGLDSNYDLYTDITIGIEETNEYEYAIDLSEDRKEFSLGIGSTTIPSGDWVAFSTNTIYTQDMCSGTSGNYIDVAVSVNRPNGTYKEWSIDVLGRSIVEIPHTFTYTVPKDNTGVRR
jgi:hypothetical protein